MKYKILSLALSLILVSGNVLAQKLDSRTGGGPNPFSDCGIGAALFENDAAAAISNIIWDLGTTAVTSGTASPETCEGNGAQAAAFIYESYDELLVESAHGQGTHLSTLMDILEVDAADRGVIINQVRADLSSKDVSSHTRLSGAEGFYGYITKAVKDYS
ncbi:MAG: DUF3015 family protein [Emcibacteraceae bacterium]|nr:DUF3015 family protein [Emcibacteraceae bacterium]